MSASATKRSTATPKSEPQDLEQQIRLRAYQLYEERGREEGHEIEDWLRAQAEMTNKKYRTATA